MATATKIRSTTFETTDFEVIGITEVDAPRDKVWKAHTEPEHLKKWMNAPEGWDMTEADMDVKEGGEWHWKWIGPGEETMEMRGEYREIQEPAKLVNTENWGEPFPETINTMTLTEEYGKTTVRTAVRYPSGDARDKAISTGMLDGWAEANERLAAYVKTME